eukprot:RCo008155
MCGGGEDVIQGIGKLTKATFFPESQEIVSAISPRASLLPSNSNSHILSGDPAKKHSRLHPCPALPQLQWSASESFTAALLCFARLWAFSVSVCMVFSAFLPSFLFCGLCLLPLFVPRP